MPKDVTFAAGFDLFLDSLSASVEKLETASRCCSESRGKAGSGQDRLPETNCASKRPLACAVKVILPVKIKNDNNKSQKA